MIADCETCPRKAVPCHACTESQRAICYVCQGDVADPYCEIPPGTRIGPAPADEAEHFIQCGHEACGAWIDCRNLGSVFDHEGPLPHPAQVRQ